MVLQEAVQRIWGFAVEVSRAGTSGAFKYLRGNYVKKKKKDRIFSLCSREQNWEGAMRVSRFHASTRFVHWRNGLTFREAEKFSLQCECLDGISAQKIKRVKNIPWVPPGTLYVTHVLDWTGTWSQTSRLLSGSHLLSSGPQEISLLTKCFLPATYFLL